MSWAYTIEKLRERIKDIRAAMVRDTMPLSGVRYHIGDLPPAEAASPSFDDSGWTPLPEDRCWGSTPESTAWLRTKVTIPENWSGHPVSLHVKGVDCETLAYLDGRPIQAFDGGHFDMVITDGAQPGQAFQVALEAYSGLSQVDALWNPYFGTTFANQHRFAEAEVRLIDRDAYEFAFDFDFAYQAAMTMDKNGREYAAVVDALEAAYDLLDFRQGGNSEAYYASVKKARGSLQSFFEAHHAGEMAPTIWATGHAHIDTAWLWRLSHTRKKCVRTFTTALELAKRYPEYVFSCSQAQQYEYIREDRPDLYEGIKAAIKSGNWQPIGGMWVESDCNVVSGESMVRQFLYGQRYIQRELGAQTNVVWLPDVFGYSAAFPQIIRKAGMKYFMTIKIFWSQINKPPYQTFKWVGIDGSDVLTHFSPLGDYNALMTPDQIRANWDRYNQKHLTNSDLLIFGFGDGGGGATYEMLENAKRAKDFIDFPKVKLASPEAFFDDLEKQVAGAPQLPVWNGELYLELHRGTYTSQGRNKRANRQSEFLYQTAEQTSALAMLLTGAVYPQAALDEGWKLILLNQFHDIIPGSSIGAVYIDSAADYSKVKQIGDAATGSALEALAEQVGGEGKALIYNPLSWAREDVAALPATLGLAGQSITALDGEAQTLIELGGQVPGLGYAVVSGGLPAGDGSLSVSATHLENRYWSIKLDENAEIESLIDKSTCREVIDSSSYCKGNALLAFEDRPMFWEAWDMDIFYNDKMYPIRSGAQVRVIETGPIRAGLEIKRTVDGGRGSTITQRMFVYRATPRIDFETELDWKDHQTLLKVAFPATVSALRATYDIQFGSIERPTHWNTTWDWAQFEVCGQKWADLSEGDYGVSLLSDSKYGWDIRGNVIRLTLLKSGISPDPEADQGIHRFTYSLLPHAGGWRDAQTIRRSYELNVPVKAKPLPASPKGEGRTLPASFSLVECESPNIVIETVKKAEDDDSLIVRFYEAHNSRGTAKLKFGRPVKSAKTVNLLESGPDGDSPSVSGDIVSVSYHPFEIRTVKVELG